MKNFLFPAENHREQKLIFFDELTKNKLIKLTGGLEGYHAENLILMDNVSYISLHYFTSLNSI
jgi:hypothetical protein